MKCSDLPAGFDLRRLRFVRLLLRAGDKRSFARADRPALPRELDHQVQQLPTRAPGARGRVRRPLAHGQRGQAWRAKPHQRQQSQCLNSACSLRISLALSLSLSFSPSATPGPFPLLPPLRACTLCTTRRGLFFVLSLYSYDIDAAALMTTLAPSSLPFLRESRRSKWRCSDVHHVRVIGRAVGGTVGLPASPAADHPVVRHLYLKSSSQSLQLSGTERSIASFTYSCPSKGARSARLPRLRGWSELPPSPAGCRCPAAATSCELQSSRPPEGTRVRRSGLLRVSALTSCVRLHCSQTCAAMVRPSQDQASTREPLGLTSTPRLSMPPPPFPTLRVPVALFATDVSFEIVSVEGASMTVRASPDPEGSGASPPSSG
jgi:hypothetical protein